jgi:hypothetical protein
MRAGKIKHVATDQQLAVIPIPETTGFVILFHRNFDGGEYLSVRSSNSTFKKIELE